MDANGEKKAQDPKDAVSTTMQEMMAKMCCPGDAGLPAMCARMMRSMRTSPDPGGRPATEHGTRSEERGRGEDDAPGGCCGPRSACPPTHP